MEILRSQNVEHKLQNDVFRVTKNETKRFVSRLALHLADPRLSVENTPDYRDSDQQRRIEQGFMISLIILLA